MKATAEHTYKLLHVRALNNSNWIKKIFSYINLHLVNGTITNNFQLTNQY